ncbi:MAG: DUF2155 domain-containing protein [Beijerinckiaceae bacterium]
MIRSHCAALGVSVAISFFAVASASAQFGSIFGAPPRPPGDVPSQFPQRNPLPGEQRGFEQQPQQRRAPQGGYQQGGVQSAPLAPPPGSAAGAPQAPSTLSGLPPGQRQPRGTPQPANPPPPQPANTAPQPGDEIVAEPPTQKIVNTSAVFAGLDKITGRIISFDVAINEIVQFGALQVVPRACYTRPPTENQNTDAFVEVSEVTLQGEVRRIFSGWMFASSPGLHGVEHPIYDIWLTDCKGGTPPAVAAAEPAPAPAPQRPRQPQQQRAQQPRGPGAAPQLMPPAPQQRF